MKKSLSRDEIIAVVNYKILSESNREYLNECLMTKKTYGVMDPNSIVITSDVCYLLKASSTKIMNTLNKSLFLKIGGYNE